MNGRPFFFVCINLVILKLEWEILRKKSEKVLYKRGSTLLKSFNLWTLFKHNLNRCEKLLQNYKQILISFLTKKNLSIFVSKIL